MVDWHAGVGDTRLVAYLVTGDRRPLAEQAHTNLIDELRTFLKVTLPEYMIPQYFLSVDEIPLTPNGKVDRRKLPLPIPDAESPAAS